MRRFGEQRATRCELPHFAKQLNKGLGGCETLTQVSAARWSSEPALQLLECRQKPLTPFDCAAPARPDCPQRNPLSIVTRDPRPKARAQKRGFSGAGRAQDHKQARRFSACKPTKAIHATYDVSTAAKEDGGILRLERLEAAIGIAPAKRALDVRLQFKGFRADACLFETAFEAF